MPKVRPKGQIKSIATAPLARNYGDGMTPRRYTLEPGEVLLIGEPGAELATVRTTELQRAVVLYVKAAVPVIRHVGNHGLRETARRARKR